VPKQGLIRDPETRPLNFARVELTGDFYPGIRRHFQFAPQEGAMTPDATDTPITTCTAFEGARRIASGPLADVALAVKRAADSGGTAPVLVFDDATSLLVEFDLRGSEAEVLARLPAAADTSEGAGPAAEGPRGPGRPRLGVVAREVTLLPRHWDWLAQQPGGASVTLRRLVDEARRSGEGRDRQRQAQDAVYRFMRAMAGDRPGFEDASRALFARDGARFQALAAAWPDDIRDHALRLAAMVFDGAVFDAPRPA
jgi:hypothetical protein